MTDHIMANSQIDTSPTWKNIKVTKETITSQGNNVRLVDSDPDNKLDLYCYVRCQNSSDKNMKSCRGVVVYDDNVLLQTYGYTSEYTVEDKANLQNSLPNIKDVVVHEAHEGVLIRVFNVNQKWYVTTHRKFDAFRSKWGSKQSFGEQFVNAVVAEYDNNEDFKTRVDTGNTDTSVFSLKNNEIVNNEVMRKFFSTLDVEKCYCFLVQNTHENRIVCQAPDRPTLFHTGTFKLNDAEYFSLDENINVPHAKSLNFESWDDLFSYTEDKVSEDKLQGLVVFEANGDHFKILNSSYKNLFSVRGNEPSIKFRYLQVRMDRAQTDLLYSLYPKHTEFFEKYENILYSVARNIYDSYVDRYIKKNFVTIPREDFQIMKECHAWHLQDRKKNRMSLRKVIELMNKQSPTNLNRIIRRVIFEAANPTKEPSPVAKNDQVEQVDTNSQNEN